MSRVELKPADLGASGWDAILPPRARGQALAWEADCDFLVIGAGFAGLSAARRLRQLEPAAKITILEAHAVASGPAGRNSGFMIDLPHALSRGAYGSGGENARDLRHIRMNRAAIAFAADCAAVYDFPPGSFDPCGKVNAAAGQVGERHNREYATDLDALGEPYELLDTAAMRELCGSDYYRGGLRTPGTALIQPAQYVCSLADALAAREACELYEHSPVRELRRDGTGWLATTTAGAVRARRVILAVNGLVETFGFYRHRLMHINLYASMTRALSADESAGLGGAATWGFTPADPIGSTVRKIVDPAGGARLVIRNRCTYEPSLELPPDRLARIARDHDRTFAARFPALAGIEMEYRWSGRLCLSRNDVWALGRLADGLYSACCQNGLGTTRGTIAGIVAAEQAAEHAGASLVPDYAPEPPPQRLLPEPFMTLGARAVIRLRELRAGREL